MSKFAKVRQANNAAFGWIVEILDVDYLQKGTKAEATEAAEKINARCAGMTASEVREHYKLGDYKR